MGRPHRPWCDPEDRTASAGRAAIRHESGLAGQLRLRPGTRGCGTDGGGALRRGRAEVRALVRASGPHKYRTSGHQSPPPPEPPGHEGGFDFREERELGLQAESVFTGKAQGLPPPPPLLPGLLRRMKPRIRFLLRLTAPPSLAVAIVLGLTGITLLDLSRKQTAEEGERDVAPRVQGTEGPVAKARVPLGQGVPELS